MAVVGCAAPAQPQNAAICSLESHVSLKTEDVSPKRPSGFFRVEYQWDSNFTVLTGLNCEQYAVMDEERKF